MFSLMALIGDPTYSYFSKGFRGQERIKELNAETSDSRGIWIETRGGLISFRFSQHDILFPKNGFSCRHVRRNYSTYIIASFSGVNGATVQG